MADLISYKVNGLKEFERRMINADPRKKVAALRSLGRSALAPVLAHQRANARRDEGDLINSLTITARTGSRTDRARLLLFKVGPLKKVGGLRRRGLTLGRINAKALSQEYGNIRQTAKPFVRPSLEKNHRRVMAHIVRGMRREWKRGR